MQQKFAISIGADPELFVTRNGVDVPIFDLVGGTKTSPIPMWPNHPTERYRKYTYQEDGAALEFNIPSTPTYDRFAGYIANAMAFIQNDLLPPRGLKTSSRGSIELSPVQLALPNAQRIGCLADCYAYDQKLPGYERVAPTAAELGSTRYAGGHIHVGYNKDAMPVNVAAQFMDCLVGLPCVRHDKQGGRRKFYGLPGLYRDKPYGIEYRTLSNFWLFRDEPFHINLAAAVCRFSEDTFEHVYVEETLKRMYNLIPWGDVHSAIANEDEKMADMLMTWLQASGMRIFTFS